MDVNQTMPVQPLGQGGGHGGGGGATGKKHHEDDQGGEQTPHGHTEPAINVSGLLSMEGLTPEAQHALERMAAEIEPLRRQLAQAKDELEEALAEAHRDGITAGLNRRGFLVELDKLIHRLGNTEARPALILVHLVNGDAIRQSLGLKTHQDALRAAYQVISAENQQALLTGALGGNDFAAVVLEDGLDGARRKADDFIGLLLTAQVPGAPALQSRMGVALLEPGMTAEAALAAADRDFL